MGYPIETVMERYCFYRQKYVMAKGDIVRAMHSGYSSKQVWEHLNGNLSLCVYAGPSNTKFLTLDVDMRDPEIVHRAIATMVELGIPKEKIYVSESGNKGYHIDIFFAESIYNWKAKELYDLIIYFGGLNKRKVEYRPTATQAIKLPLGIHQRTGKRCWFVDRDTLEPIEDFRYIEATSPIDVAEIDRIIEQGNKLRFSRMISDMPTPGESQVSRMPRGETFIAIHEVGTRQSRMLDEALRLYRAGGDQASIERDLEIWMEKQNPALYKDTQEECRRNIVNIAKWVVRKGRRSETKKKDPVDTNHGIRIYRSDAERIISRPTKTARMLAFLITVYCDRYGECGLSQQKMGEILSIKSRRIIVEAAKAMGCFDSKQGGLKNAGGELKRVTTKYSFPEGYSRDGEYIILDTNITSDNVYSMYLKAIGRLCDDGELRKALKKPEYADMRR